MPRQTTTTMAVVSDSDYKRLLSASNGRFLPYSSTTIKKQDLKGEYGRISQFLTRSSTYCLEESLADLFEVNRKFINKAVDQFHPAIQIFFLRRIIAKNATKARKSLQYYVRENPLSYVALLLGLMRFSGFSERVHPKLSDYTTMVHHRKSKPYRLQKEVKDDIGPIATALRGDIRYDPEIAFYLGVNYLGDWQDADRERGMLPVLQTILVHWERIKNRL